MRIPTLECCAAGIVPTCTPVTVKMVDAAELFHHIAEWKVIVCKACRISVWPDHISGHLTGQQHRISRKDATAISNEVGTWPGVAHNRSEFEVPSVVPQSIAEIPLYTDGLKCIRDPSQCSYICRGRTSIRNHWREKHGWLIQSGRGGGGQRKKEAVQRRFATGAKEVECQRFFVQGAHSQYFEVCRTIEAPAEQARLHTKHGAMQRIWMRANEYAEASEKRKQDAIQPGDTTETTPWIRRTGWDRYLSGCDRSDLLEVIAQPEESDKRDRSGDESSEEEWERKVDQALWKTMGELATISQSVVRQSGVMLRMEAVRSEVGQQRFTPLRPYQEATSIERHCRPWQQMLMFFVRTQRPHDWHSPVYRFNRRQKTAFEDMIEAVGKEARHGRDEAESEEEESEDEGSHSAGDDEGLSHQTHTSPDKEDPGPQLRAVHRACLRFCIELMNQTIHNQEYDMAMVCATAVLGVHAQHGFRDPESYPPILSSIIKVARFMIVQQAEEIAQPTEGDEQYSPCASAMQFESDADSGYDGEDQSPVRGQRRHTQHPRSPGSVVPPTTSFGWVQQMVRTFMARGTAGPIQWLLDLRTYGLKIHYNTTAIGHVNWKDKHTLEYKNLAFTMDEFRGMVHQLVADSRQALLEDMLFVSNADELPAIPWGGLHDDPSNRGLGWSWMQDQRSRLPTDGQEWLYERIQAREDLQDRFVSSTSEGGYHGERVRDWMRQVARFRGLLLVLMHITGGQPARGTEILSCRHRNTAAGSHRNVFIEDGQVVFVTKYHKGVEITGDVKIIHRYLPREVGELVVWYLWLALPFIERIQALVWQETAMSDHLWPTEPDGRQWTTDRMKGELQRVSTKALGQSISVAAYREIAIAVSRQWVRGDSAFQRDNEDENIEARIDSMDGNAADEQATHSPHIAGLIYARDVMDLVGSSADRRRRFRKVSEDWHPVLGFESTAVKDEQQGPTKRKWCGFEDDAEEEQGRRRARLRRMDAQAELSWMMRKEMTLRSVQGEAMQAIQRGDSQIVTVMPTGAGKSVLFMLPAFVEPRGVSIIVVPLKGIRADMIYRCEQLGIRWAAWGERAAVDGASIVLVTPEKAVLPEFGTFIKRLKRLQSLDRIVIDECHVVLNDRLDFRKMLQELGKLSIAETQMVLLTATLPPHLEDTLFERMFWQREEVTLIRGSTVRPNIAYSVIEGGDSPAARSAQLEAVVTEALSDPTQPEGKVLVMCESVPGVEQVNGGGLFPCEQYHAKMSDAARAEVLEQFRNGATRVVVATGAFGMGIDIPDIRLVVFVDEPRSMLEYGQTSGRGGRDGLPSRGIIIRGGLQFHDPLVQQYMQDPPAQCRRIAIDRYLDGNPGRVQCQADEQPCDHCQQQMEFEDSPVTQEFEPEPATQRSGTEPGTHGSDMERSTRQRETEGVTHRAGTERSTRQRETGRVTRQGETERSTRREETERSARQNKTGPLTQIPAAEPASQAAESGYASQLEAPRRHVPTGVPFDSSIPGSVGNWESRWREYPSSSRAPSPPRPHPIEARVDWEAVQHTRAQDRHRRTPEVRRIRQAQQAAVSIEQIEQRLSEWKNRCVVCSHEGQPDRHIISHCPSPVGQTAEKERKVAASKGGIAFAKQIVCYRCGLSRKMCERWTVGGFRESGQGCQFYGVLMGVVYGIKHACPWIWEQWWKKGRWKGA